MASKRAAVSRGPLDSEAVVRQVLSYVGPGHWLICALVSRKWHELYAEVQSIEQEVYDYEGETCLRTITASMTLYSAVFTSVSQVELARSCGLKLRSRARPLQLAAGRNGDAETLLAARKLGMPWADCLLNSIAKQGDLPKLQVLLASNKCRLPIDVSKYAARSGSIELLKWLKQKGCPITIDTAREAAHFGQQELITYLHTNYWHKLWDLQACDAAASTCQAAVLCWLLQHNCKWDNHSSAWQCAAQQGKVDVMEHYRTTAGWPMPSADQLRNLLNIAGAHSFLAVCQWLRQRGATWPDVLQHTHKRWTGDTLAWARAEGCDSPVQHQFFF
eukprot:14743-Heterococcus_DN1.PRE.8